MTAGSVVSPAKAPPPVRAAAARQPAPLIDLCGVSPALSVLPLDVAAQIARNLPRELCDLWVPKQAARDFNKSTRLSIAWLLRHQKADLQGLVKVCAAAVKALYFPPGGTVGLPELKNKKLPPPSLQKLKAEEKREFIEDCLYGYFAKYGASHPREIYAAVERDEFRFLPDYVREQMLNEIEARTAAKRFPLAYEAAPRETRKALQNQEEDLLERLADPNLSRQDQWKLQEELQNVRRGMQVSNPWQYCDEPLGVQNESGVSESSECRSDLIPSDVSVASFTRMVDPTAVFLRHSYDVPPDPAGAISREELTRKLGPDKTADLHLVVEAAGDGENPVTALARARGITERQAYRRVRALTHDASDLLGSTDDGDAGLRLYNFATTVADLWHEMDLEALSALTLPPEEGAEIYARYSAGLFSPGRPGEFPTEDERPANDVGHLQWSEAKRFWCPG